MIPKIKNIKPDPAKDQHFLTNPNMVKKLISVSGIKPRDQVLEIGAGPGNLTRELAGKKAEIIAVEADKGFGEILRNLKYGNLRVIYGNALRVMDKIKFNKIVSNLPYSICEPILNRLSGKDFDYAVLSIPEKFYRRICSKPGERYYSLLTLRTGAFFKIDFKFSIPKEDFYPPPKTETVVVLVKPLSKKDYQKTPWKYVMREIFLQGKKKLKNSLLEGLINLNRKILGRDSTKNLARKTIRKMNLGEELLGKRTENIGLSGFDKLRTRLTFSS